MHLFRIPLAIIASLLFSASLFAQPGSPVKTGSITGKLVDAKNVPVSYATVTLLRTDSSVVNGDLSKEDGTFLISPAALGSMLLRIEAIGVATKYTSITVTADQPDKNVGAIKVIETDNKLKEVSVTGEKPVMELKVDKKVFNVEKNTTTAGGSASDVLQNVPSVSVDADGNVSLRGNSAVTVLIDGKPATMLGSDVASALQSLSAASIENVEVITNPSAKYDAQGTGGIINIITKKDSRFGINGTATVGAGTNDKYNGNLGLNVRKGKWNAFLNSSYRLNNTYNNVTTDRTDKMDDQSYHTYEHVPRQFGGFFNTVGVSYDPNKNNSFTLTENINRMGFSYKDNSDYNIYPNTQQAGPSVFEQNRYTDFGVNLLSSSTALDYKHKFKKQGEELSVDGTFAYTSIDRRQNYVTNYPDSVSASPVNPVVQHSPAVGDNSTTNIWADYTDPLFTKNGKLGLGFKSQLYTFESNGNPVVSIGNGPFITDAALVANYNYTQQIHAVYANWSDQMGKLSYQVGLRGEDAIYNGKGTLAANKNETFNNSFVNLFPSAFISYQLDKMQSIYLNYSRRTNRPDFRQLLPFADLSNPGTVNEGNPALIPEFINNIEFSYNRVDNKGNNIILSAYYAYTENLIEKITTTDSAEASNLGVTSKTLISKPYNISSGTTYGVEGTGHLQLLPIWDATLNVNFFENQLNIGSGSPELSGLSNNSGFTWFGKLNTNLKLPKNFSFQVNANYESPKIIAQGSIRESYWVDVALRKNLWKNKATVILNCSDIFNTHKNITDYNLTAYSETINRVRETRIGNITFTYRFGKSDIGKNIAGGKGGKAATDDKLKPVKPTNEDRQNNLKEGGDDDQGGNGGGGGAGGGKKDGGGRN